jgi:hypothetical protein
LPPSWTTLYELTKLDDDTFDRRAPCATNSKDPTGRPLSSQGRARLLQRTHEHEIDRVAGQSGEMGPLSTTLGDRGQSFSSSCGDGDVEGFAPAADRRSERRKNV